MTMTTTIRDEHTWAALFFPATERVLPGERTVRVLLRTAHLASMALLLGGHFFAVYQERLAWPLMATLGTGLLFVALELYGTCDWLFQVRGLMTLAKLALLALVPFYWDERVFLLMSILVLASVSSHMPSRLRYWSVLRRRCGLARPG